jgi:pyruvate/oxaloacetate carboxyltransferase
MGHIHHRGMLIITAQNIAEHSSSKYIRQQTSLSAERKAFDEIVILQVLPTAAINFLKSRKHTSHNPACKVREVE